MIYKVLNTRSGAKKDDAYAYCKRKGELKKLIKISTRGLARVMWGKDLPRIGVSVPSSLLNLMKKSNKLNTLNFNEINLDKSNDETALNITNRAKNIENYGKMAESQGYKKVINYIMRRLKEIAGRNKEV